jgi:tetratricopeptide (TPR) repeat protein
VNAEVAPDRLEEQFHGILRTLDASVPDLTTFRQSERNAARELASALEALAARERVLFVVDNVPEPGAEPDEVQKPLETWCPAIGKVSLLATSRARLDLGTEGVYGLALSTLSPDAAVALLTEGIGRGRVDEAGWQRIAEWVGHLPLALELLNRAMKVGGLDPEEVLSRAESREPVQELDQQARFLRRYVPPGALRGITEAFTLSYERLSQTEQRAARLMAQLAPEPIPLALLKALGEEVFSGEVRTSLRARHFVMPVETGAVSLFGSMHRVLASYLRGLSPGASSELVQVCHALVDLMTQEACLDPQSWPLLQTCLPHAESVFTRLGRLGAHGDIEQESLLGLRLGLFLSSRGVIGRALRIEEQVVARAQELLGPEHLSTLTAMHNLAQTLYKQGNLVGARALEERVLEVEKRVLGEEHPDTLTTMNNLAVTLNAQGDLEGARALQERVVEVRRRVQGEEHPDTHNVMSNLAATLWAQGNLKGARALQERGLEMRRRVQGEEHPDTLTVMNNLAATLNAQGDVERARALQERGLEVRRRVQGEEHPDTLKAINNLAAMLYAQGDLGGARALQERGVEVRRRVQGEEHPDSLTEMTNLATTLYDQRDLRGARALQERVVEVRRRVQGEEHPDTLTAMSDLAVTLKKQGDVKGARALEKRVRELRRKGPPSRP